MLLFLRKFLFYVLAAVYFVLVPYVILYALGYLIHPSKAQWIKTGLLSVETVPEGAHIFVENKKFSRRSPAVISELTAGAYRVRIVKKGYHSWEKEVVIHPEKATQLEPVVLRPYRPETEVLSPEPYSGLVPGAAGHRGISGLVDSRVLVWKSHFLDSLAKVDLFFKREIRPSVPLAWGRDYRILRVFYREGSSLAVFEVESQAPERAPETEFFIFETGSEQKTAKNLRRPFKMKADFLCWDPKNEDQLYFLENGAVTRVDIREGAFYPRVATEVLGLGVSDGRLYLLKNDFTVVQTNLRGENVRPFFEDPFPGRSLFGGRDARYYRLEPLTHNGMIFLDERGGLLSSFSPYEHFAEGVLGIHRYEKFPAEEKLIFWSAGTAGILDFSAPKDELLSRGPAVTFPYGGGKDIRQAFWAYGSTHMILLDQDRVFLAEAKGPEPSLAWEIARVLQGSSIDYHDKNRTLLYLDPGTGHLIKQKLAG